jgi:NAD(P)-dependent dehydrogenase (short-subunit alcohol dehydrogenase family)
MTAETKDKARVALVAGATRGAGRAIAVELARAGLFVYATGRSSRISGGSEMNRPETIEETGERMQAAGGAGSALVVDHEDPTAVAELLAAIDRGHGRLDVLVNDIFGGDRYAEWDKPLWEHDWAGGDADAHRWAGEIISARQLADTYGLTDTDGSRPDCWGYLAAYGWEQDDGTGIDQFR